MAFVNKTPPIKIFLNKYEYNCLLEVINSNPEFSKLKDKLLTYSSIFKSDAGVELVNVSLYAVEAKQIITCLIKYCNIKTNIDYFEVLKKVKQSKKFDDDNNE